MMADQDLGGASGFPCKQCDMVCPTVSSLLEHMDVHHQQEDERKYKCDECGRCYRHAGSLTNHRRTHEVGPFRCPECGKENSNASALKSHLRIHTSCKKYFCGECGKGFRLATQLATHERVHLAQKVKEESEFRNDAPQQSGEHFTCLEVSTETSLCEDKTEELSNSQFEACDESEERPFRCDMCGKSYIHQRSLNNHKKSHQLGKFECSVCFKLFNNMAALYSHHRSHKAKSGSDFSLTDRSHKGTELDQFSPKSQRAPENFCHLCQVHLSTEEAFQEHIQMHNSSSLSFRIEDAPSENHNVSYDGGVSPDSKLYSSNNCIPSVSLDNAQNFGKTACHSSVLMGCSIDQKPHFSTSQRESSVVDSSIDSCTGIPAQNSCSVSKVVETSTADSDERPFKCHICGKCYRHSGSLINHKRSHQVGVFQCSVCKKNYPHLAALKSHLRLHKTQSFQHGAEEDCLGSKPLSVDSQHSSFSFQTEQVGGVNPVLEEPGIDHSGGVLYQKHFDQDSSQDMMTQLPKNENVMQRHMCADCGGTFTDIADIKSHSCPFLLHQPETAKSDYISGLNLLVSNGHSAVGNPEGSVEFHGLNGSHSQSFFKETFHENMSSTQLNNGAENNPVEEDDGDLYQCSICGNNYSSMGALRCHLRGHTQSSDTPTSSGPSSMSSHEDVKEENGEIMICSACGESFANRLDLINHQIQHNKDQEEVLDHSHNEASESKEDQPIICGGCGISCTSYNHLDNHSCTAERRDELVECKQEADDVFKQEETSPRREPDDAEDRQYKCEQCGRSYRHAGSLLNHKKSHKTGLFRCQICQKRFYNLLALKNHQRSHFDIKRYTCHECGKAFKIQKQLLIHLRRHRRNQAKMQELGNQIQALMQMNGSRSDGKLSLLPSNANPASASASASAQPPAQEPEGKRAETEAESSVTSKDTSDQRPFACDQCGRTYRHAGSLVNHKNSHKTGEYYCSICNNTYSNQLAMKNHLRTHFLYKRHTCQNCGRGFRGKKQLLAHVCSDLRKDGAAGRRVLKSRLFKCKDCKQAFLSVDQLSSHTCDGHSDSRESQSEFSPIKEERPFRCNICGRSYRHAGSLLNHKNTHKTGHFSCTFCSKPFTNPMALRNHTRIHTQKKKFVCLTCGKAFRLASILHNHQRIHNRVLSHFSCPPCGRSFQSRSSLRRHHCRRGQARSGLSGGQRSERGNKCFTCDLCGRSYRHAGSLLNHKKSHSENLHHCALCLQTFPDSLTLQIHSQMRRHCCPECGKTFCLITHLQSHMEVHTKEQAVVCGLCQQSFPNASSYKEHQSTHDTAQSSYPQGVEIPAENSLSWDSVVPESLETGDTQKQDPPTFSQLPRDISDSQVSSESSTPQEKSHVCEHCGRTYRHAGSLLNHKNSHKTGAFFCSVCHKEFTNLMALKNHRRIHTEPKRYQCLECGKAFRVSTQLICHRRIHTKEKPFTCQLCSKNFSSKSNLRHHQKMHQSSTQTYNATFSMDSFMDLDMGSFL